MDAKTFNLFALSQTKYSPDIAFLEESEFQLVFLCDDLMLNGSNHKLIAKHSRRRARGFTRKHFSFYRRRVDGQGVPILGSMPDNRYDFASLKIKGEIHQVSSSLGMPKLDNHYQNTVQFRRERVQILYPTQEHGMILNKDTMGRPLPLALQGPKHFLLPEKVEPIWAWMYFGIKKYWGPLLDGGFYFERVRISYPKEDKNWLPKYYHFQNRP